MNGHDTFTNGTADILGHWVRELHGAAVSDVAPAEAIRIAGAAAAASGLSAIAAAPAAALEGGAMTTTASAAAGATAGASLTTKLAAATLAAALTAGGAAAATGSLPDGMQSFASNAAAHIGIDLPAGNVTATVDTDAGLRFGAGEIVDLGAAGRLSAAVDGSAGIVLTGIEEAAGFTASIVSQTEDSVLVEFESSSEGKTSVLLTALDGQLVATVTTDGEARAEADGAAEAGADASTEGDAGSDASVSGEAEAESSTSVESDGGETSAETEGSIRIDIGS